jgi:PAS domain S-box-containing protein
VGFARKITGVVQQISHARLEAIGVTAAVGIAYFTVARLGLALRTGAGLAIFWPAAGVAIGALIALGAKARLPVAAAVAAATIASSLMIGRSLWLALALSLVNAGQVLLVAWIVGRWFGSAFKLEDVGHVLGFLLSATIGAGVGAAGAVAAISLVEPSAFSVVWRVWFAACLLGTVTVAPLIIGLGDAVRQRPPRRELTEGGLAVAILALLSVILIALPQTPWTTAVPVALASPVLLWVCVRCAPVFAAGGSLVIATAIIWSITLDLGHFGDRSIPLDDRIIAAQTLILAGSLLALILAALFAERRRSELTLKQGNERLQLALNAAELGTFSADLGTGHLQCDARAAMMHGHVAPPTTIKESRRFVHHDDLQRIDAAVAKAKRTGGGWKAQYRVVPPPDHPLGGETRWIEVESSLVRKPRVGLLGVTRDVTARKMAEQALAERDTQLALAGKTALVGSFAVDVASGRMQVSPGYAAIHGLPEGILETTQAEWRTRVDPDDLFRLEAIIRNDTASQTREHFCEYRITRPGGGVRWIESRAVISYNSEGSAKRIVGADIDVTERRRAEEALCERNAQLELASKMGRVGSFTVDLTTGIVRLSPGCATLYGLSEGTLEISRSDARKHVHPEDLDRVDASRNQALLEQRPELIAQFRIVRADNGEVRWVESRSLIAYGEGGRPIRVIGVSIDVTDRKLTEDHKSFLISELDHRVKNTLACIAVMVEQTRAGRNSMDEFLKALQGRIQSLANMHTLLSINRWQGIGLAELIRGELSSWMQDTNTLIEGPAIDVNSDAAQTLAIVLHELVTNAAKYGALSHGRGRVAVRWDWHSTQSAGDRLALEWSETDGPPTLARSAPGYGTSVIRDLIPYELGGTVDYVLANKGVRCKIEIPAKWLKSSGKSLHDGTNSPSQQPHPAP